MAGLEVVVAIDPDFREEARNFLEFLKKAARKFPVQVRYQSSATGTFKVELDGPSGSLDGLLQELTLSRGLYYYACSLHGQRRRQAISRAVVPLYQELIESRFYNPYSGPVRRHLAGVLESGLMPGDFFDPFSHEYEVIFRKWDLGLLTDWDFIKDLDSLLTRFMLTSLNHPAGQKSDPFPRLLSRARQAGLALVDETVALFNEIHAARTGGLHRLDEVGREVVARLALQTYNYFAYFDEFVEAQQTPTEKLKGRRYRRIRYGYERGDMAGKSRGDDIDRAKNVACHDCAAVFGQFHAFGCDWEECARCGTQRLSCGCGLDLDSSP